MASEPGDREPGIGSTLKETRTRQGLDIRTVEEQTKIRIKYLRALENEEWDVLPGPAYARGFLRTYAELLGLDGDALVDRYRAHVERSPEGPPRGPIEPLLHEGRPLGGGPRFSGRLVVALLVVGIAAALLVLGLTAGSDDDGGEPRGRAGQKQRERPQKEEQAPVPDTATVRLVALSDTEVCLVSKGGDVLLDNQLMAEGDEEGPFEADGWQLSVGPGALELTLNGEPQRFEPAAPTTYEIRPQGARPAGADPSPDCP